MTKTKDTFKSIGDVAKNVMFDIADKNGVMVDRYTIEPNYKNSTIKELSDDEIAEKEDKKAKRKTRDEQLKKDRENRYKASDSYNPYQEAHSPTMDVAGKRSQMFCRRRVQDVRVQDRIDEVNGNVAAIRISRAYHHIIHGLGIKAASYTQTFERRGLESIMSDSDWLDYLGKCESEYKKWHELFEDRVNCSAVLDIVYWGMSFDAITKKYRKRNGWASENLVLGLELYNKMERNRQ